MFASAIPRGRVRWDGSLTSLPLLSKSQVLKWEQICTSQVRYRKKDSTVSAYGIYIQMSAELRFHENHGSWNYGLELETRNFPHECHAKFFSCRTGYLN